MLLIVGGLQVLGKRVIFFVKEAFGRILTEIFEAWEAASRLPRDQDVSQFRPLSGDLKVLNQSNTRGGATLSQNFTMGLGGEHDSGLNVSRYLPGMAPREMARQSGRDPGQRCSPKLEAESSLPPTVVHVGILPSYPLKLVARSASRNERGCVPTRDELLVTWGVVPMVSAVLEVEAEWGNQYLQSNDPIESSIMYLPHRSAVSTRKGKVTHNNRTKTHISSRI